MFTVSCELVLSLAAGDIFDVAEAEQAVEVSESDLARSIGAISAAALALVVACEQLRATIALALCQAACPARLAVCVAQTFGA